jgi:hypothetical protein
VGESIIAHAVTPSGRLVVIAATRWAHVLSEHEDMAPHLDDVVAALEFPDHQESDYRPGRERYFKQGVGPESWLRVVIEFGGATEHLVTAFAQDEDPRERQ